jgi:hypothetical protein
VEVITHNKGKIASTKATSYTNKMKFGVLWAYQTTGFIHLKHMVKAWP